MRGFETAGEEEEATATGDGAQGWMRVLCSAVLPHSFFSLESSLRLIFRFGGR